MNLKEFEESLFEVLRNKNDKTEPLEKYLRKLFKQILMHQDKKVTYDLFLEIFTLALESEPAVFKPELDEMIKNESKDSKISEDVYYTLSDLHSCIRDFIKIDDIIKAKDSIAYNTYKYFGEVNIPGGHTLHNLGITGIVSSFFSYIEDVDAYENTVLDWRLIGNIFDIGTQYE